MKIKTLILGSYQTNCYIVSDEQSNDAFLIDPGFEAERIKKCINDEGLNLLFIINTHGHADHIGMNAEFNVPVYIHTDDADFLIDPVKNLSALVGGGVCLPKADKLLKDSDVINFHSIKIEVLHTPGHSPGCICLKVQDALFSGDTLFKESIGRTDFPYGDSRQILESIRSKILPLDDSLIVYPGHGESSTIAWERKHNYFLSSLLD